jgi:hypothetical protein
MENRNIKAEIRAKGDNESRTVTFVASTYDKDRHGTVLNQKNWSLDNFNANPVIGYQHNVYGEGSSPNPDDQLGFGRAYVEGKELLIDITFEPADINPLAEKIFKKIQHGSLRAVSVGFVPLKSEDGKFGEERDGAFHFFGQELLEVSVVNIPSNPKALKKSLDDMTEEEMRTYIKSLTEETQVIEDQKVVEEKYIGKDLNFCKKILLLYKIK